MKVASAVYADVPCEAIHLYRPDLENIPPRALPAPFSLRAYRPGDEGLWLAMQRQNDPLITFDDGMFERQFGAAREALAERQMYLVDGAGQAVGTATAWFTDIFDGKPAGQVHWVLISAACQGRGLANALMTAVLQRLKELGHRRAFLGTQAPRIAAVNLYLKYGFQPYLADPAHRARWERIRPLLKYPVRLP